MQVNWKELNKVLNICIDSIQTELVERWNNADISDENRELLEVVFGLLSRQVSITIYFLSSPFMWNHDVGIILLRSIAENIINLTWILKDDSITRAKMFIKHGLGQEKLQFEHRKQEMSGRETTEEEQEYMEQWEQSIEGERYALLTDVNLGSWSGKTTLNMAEEVGYSDFYHFVFTPCSNATHGTWNHITKYALKYSTDPIHNFLRRPIFYDLSPDLNVAELAMEYMDQALKRYDDHFEKVAPEGNSYNLFLSHVEEMKI
jgi:hypothetical protein